jgi:phospholipid/cholesterol/gamma-HCH transport system substrate-binding protein
MSDTPIGPGEGAAGDKHPHLPVPLPHLQHHAHHSHPGLTATIVKVVIFTAVSVLITSIVVTSLLDLDVNPTRNYAADFTNVSGLQPGDTVRIAGVEVGKVGSVGLQGNHARVTFSLDSSQHLTTTSTATVHFENLLGQRFLAILPGPTGGQPLRAGGTIPLSQTTPALDLTAVFDGFAPLFSALQPSQVNQLSQSIIGVFQGESGTVDSLVAQTAAITSNLADRQAVISGLLTSLASLLNSVGSHDTQLSQLIVNFDSLVSGLANSRSQLGSAIDNLNSLTTTVSGLLNQSQPQLDQDISGLASATQSLSNNQKGINSLLQGFPGLLNTVTKIQSSGNWINAYICNLTVNVQGPPLNISIIPGAKFPTYPANITLPSGAVGDQAVHTASCS